MEVLSQHLPGGSAEKQETLIPAEIPTAHRVTSKPVGSVHTVWLKCSVEIYAYY
jgi:hypothetical protein